MFLGDYIKQIFSQNTDKIAIPFGAEEYTCSHVDKITDIIAYNITSRKIAVGSRIGILMERNAKAIFVLLGIIKAGCIYAPLSKENPILRIRRMLEMADINCIITDDKSEVTDCKEINYSELVAEKSDIFRYERSYTDKVYTIFTSGTTGFPKAFDITSDAIINLVKSLTDVYFEEEVDKSNIIGELAELSFDMSQGQIYLALLNGKILNVILSDVKKNLRSCHTTCWIEK